MDARLREGCFVTIISTKQSELYKDLLNEQGIVQKIKTWTDNYGTDRTTVYVAVSGHINDKQENGWFLFTPESLRVEAQKDDYVTEPWRATWLCCDDELTPPYIKIKEEKKEMELLELYFKRKRDDLEVKYNEKREKIKRKDVMYTEVMDLRKKYAHIAEFNIYVTNSYKFSTEIETEIIKNDREYDKKLDELFCQLQEIKAQLDICETYEQKMNVLKIYNVVDEKGKLNV